MNFMFHARPLRLSGMALVLGLSLWLAGCATPTATQTPPAPTAPKISAPVQQPALVAQDLSVVSYADLAGRVARFAQRLGTARKLVAVEAETTVEAIVAYLAALAGGHVAALLPAGDADALARFRRDFAPEAVFARQGGGWRLILDPRPTAGVARPRTAS